MSQSLPPVAALVTHPVADYEAWKKVFDEHQPDREAASFLGHHINRGADDADRITIYSPASDVEKARAFLEDSDLPEVMKRAGVQGPPTITLLKPMSADFIPDRKLAGMIATHAVENYATWRTAYDELDSFRSQSGIIGNAVNQQLGKPNQVIVYHQAEQLDALRTFVDSTELKEAMQRAGVVGPPDIQFVHVADCAEY